MAIRYTEEALLHLRQSPLCVKPNNLPPLEDWMGPPPETFRNNNQQNTKSDGNRNRHDDGSMLDQNNRRPGVDRHVSRNSANPEEIILGPPRTTFSSSTLSRNAPADKPMGKDSDGRFPFRTRPGEIEGADRNRSNRNPRERDARTNFGRRGDADQDSDGWTAVKPRKSFGADGAERFQGRMGERTDRFGGERRLRDGEEGDRSRRNFGEFGKDKDADDGTRRTGTARNRGDQTWSRSDTVQSEAAPTPARERFDRAKSWRERTTDDQQNDSFTDKGRDRGHDRRWDRDQRQEREPEWMDEPADEKNQAHTQEDFQKFMESMKAARAGPKAETTQAADPARGKLQDIEPPADQGPDKFFAAYGQGSALDSPAPETVKENTAPSKAKASRFQNFFSNQEETRRHVEATPPPMPRQAPPPGFNPLLELLGAGPPATTAPPPGMGLQDIGPPPQSDVAEKVAFQSLLAKLQKQSFSSPPPNPNGGFPEPPPSHELGLPKGALGPAGFPYGPERREGPPSRDPPQPQEMHAPRPQQLPHMAAGRPDQQQHMLHELMSQRQNTNSQGPPPRHEQQQPPSRNSNSNTEFLMTLMQQGARGGSIDHGRHDKPPMRMPQPSRQAQIPPTPDREEQFQRERSASQHQGGRPQGLPGFFDEPPHLQHREQEGRGLQQPTQILQRQQGPPGLDQMHPMFGMQPGAGQQMPPGRPMIPPPGLGANHRNGPSGPNGPNGPMPGMFPPNFPMGNFPPPEGMPPGPPRNMPPPPGFFGGPPPPGFMGPPPGMGGFPGPEGVGFGFDGRGMPPPAANGPFRRQ